MKFKQFQKIRPLNCNLIKMKLKLIFRKMKQNDKPTKLLNIIHCYYYYKLYSTIDNKI